MNPSAPLRYGGNLESLSGLGVPEKVEKGTSLQGISSSAGGLVPDPVLHRGHGRAPESCGSVNQAGFPLRCHSPPWNWEV